MQTLYVSDLDGTLLNERAEISPYTKEILTRCIEQKHMLFTVATARSPATVMKIMQGIPLNLPLIVLTGSVLYDPIQNSYPYIESFFAETIAAIVHLLDAHRISAFVQSIENNFIRVYYKRLSSDFEQLFVKRRSGTPYKEFVQTNQYERSLQSGKITLFTIIDKKDVVDYLLPKFQAIPNTICYCYQEEYGSDYYYLEIFSRNTSKAHALQQLQSKIGASSICSFGDNINDISMFQISQESYAVQNATDAALSAASAVIGSNTLDGVAHFLKNRFFPESSIL